MTRNQKIALGCGGAGCLGLIVVAIAAVLIYYFAWRAAPYRDRSFSTSTNRNSNSNDNSDVSANANDENDNISSSSNSSSTSVSSMSDDDKHKLYHAAFVTSDQALLRRVSVKLGLMNEDFTPGEEMAQFLVSHALWTVNNQEFIQSINTPEKARNYVDENFPN